jgi:predicted ATPase/DNA-binding SARP family transcriptional activator
VRLFGPPEVLRDGAPVRLLRQRTRALLYFLAAEPRRHSRERLGGLLWPDALRPRRLLSEALSDLRTALGPGAIDARAEDVAWAGPAADVARFEALLDAAGAASLRGLPEVESAVALYRGELLEGVVPEGAEAFEGWLVPRRAALAGRALDAVSWLARRALAAADPARAVREAQRGLALDPTREDLHAVIMEGLAAAGNVDGARRQLRIWQDVARRELDAEPSAEVVALAARLDARPRTGPPAAPAAAAADAPEGGGPPPAGGPGALPAAGPLIGRGGALDDVRRLLLDEGARLVTLTGAGGIGKTHLALHVAGRLLGEGAFPGGVCFVDLAPVTDPGAVADAVVRAAGLGALEGASGLERLLTGLAGRRLLLVLDNFEQVVPAAPQVASLLNGLPLLRVLVTSREPLRLRQEREFDVPALAVPRPGADPAAPETLGRTEAVALFVARARARQADFRLTPQNAPEVAELCRRLDGLPLAVELAAARIKLLPPGSLLRRLDRRLSLLTEGARDAPARHQTLRATIDWSHDLLSEPERALFARLAVFAGGWTLDAAEAVCAGAPQATRDAPEPDVLASLGSLADKSLVRRDEGAEGEPRFRMLETLRAYALERLEASGEADTVRRRHAAHALAFAERAAAALYGPEQSAWLRRIDSDYENLRAALRWLLERGDGDPGLRLGAALWLYWTVREHLTEGRTWLDALLQLPAPPATVARRPEALFGAGLLAWYQRDDAAAQRRFEEAVAQATVLADRRTVALARLGQGLVAAFRSDFARAAACFEASRSDFLLAGDEWGLSWALVGLAQAVRAQGGAERARPLLEEALAVARVHTNDWGLAHALHGLATLAFDGGDSPAARTYLEEALTAERRLGRRDGVAWALEGLGRVALYAGDTAEARARYEAALALRREEGRSAGFAWALLQLGEVAMAAGDIPGARVRIEEALAVYRELGHRRLVPWALLQLCQADWVTGEFAGARARLREALAAYRELDNRSGLATALEHGAGLAAAEGDAARALRLAGAAAALRETIKVPRSAPRLQELERRLERARRRLDPADQDAEWAAGRALSLEDAIVTATATATGRPDAATDGGAT